MHALLPLPIPVPALANDIKRAPIGLTGAIWAGARAHNLVASGSRRAAGRWT